MRTIACLLLLAAACSKTERIAAFPPTASTIEIEGVVGVTNGWKVIRGSGGSVRLFEVTDGLCDGCFLLYRARVKTEAVEGRAYLELWVRVRGGEFFSKGFDSALSGTEDWTAIEIPFRLEPGQKPEVAKLNLAIEGKGTAWIRDIELWKRPF